MSIQVFYEYTDDAQYEEITDRVRLYTLDLTQNAEEGSVALSKVTIDDPDGDYDIVGWRRMYFRESTATGSNQVIYNGYVADRNIKRGPYRTGAGRVFEVALSDSNVVASWRILNGTDANRPAETDVARVQWLMGTDEMSRIPLTTYLNTTGGVAMDAVDYRGQSTLDVLRDCSQQSGKNFCVLPIDSGSGDVGLGIWYGGSDLAIYSSPLRITTDLDDVDSSFVFAASEDTVLNRDPSRTFSGVYLRADNNITVYEERTTTSNEFTRRDVVMPADNVKTAAKATARAQRYLTDLSREEDVITTSILVPPSKVNFVKPGMRIPFKAQHLPGYEQYIWMRVLKHQVSQTESEDLYRIQMELELIGPLITEPSAGCTPEWVVMGGSVVASGNFPASNPERVIDRDKLTFSERGAEVVSGPGTATTTWTVTLDTTHLVSRIEVLGGPGDSADTTFATFSVDGTPVTTVWEPSHVLTPAPIDVHAYDLDPPQLVDAVAVSVARPYPAGLSYYSGTALAEIIIIGCEP